MIPKVSIFLLLVLNLYLLVSMSFTDTSLKSVEEQQRLQFDALRREFGRFAVDRARLKADIGSLGRAVDGLKREASSVVETAKRDDLDHQESPTTTEEEQFAKEGYAQYEATLARIGLDERPVPENIPLMTEGETAELLQKISEMPKLDDSLLRERDIYELLKDPGWNPDERELDGEELEKLRGLVNDFTYYSEYAQTERLWKYVLPEIPELRDYGAFIEYSQEEPPPPMEGAVYSHAEPSELEGYFRMYYFHAEDYPDIRHHKQVEVEQSRKIYRDVYAVINGE